jgi:signal transduction histidine kinase
MQVDAGASACNFQCASMLKEQGVLEMTKRHEPSNNQERVPSIHKAARRSDPRELGIVAEQLLLSCLRADETIDDLRIIGEDRDRLMGIVSHDLRNPLSAITMGAALLARDQNLSANQRQLAQRVLDSAGRMNGLVAQLIEFTRVRRGGGLELDVRDVNLFDLCVRVASELRLGVSAIIDVHGTSDVCGRWDVDRLSQAISNVLGNAVDHATPATIVDVDVHFDAADSVVEISNQGKPINPELLPVIFQPFRGGVPDAGRRDHLGLGLYIAHEAVCAHGGTISVASREGLTVFTVRLPRFAL